MKRLWPLVTHHPDEGATSLLSRLALLHGRVPRQFCRDMALHFQGIVDGVREALADFARLADASLEELAANTPRKIDDRSYELCGERLTRHTLRRSVIHTCPRCLAEDIARAPGRQQVGAYGRAIWSIDAIRTCQTHAVGLAEIARASTPGALHDFAAAAAPFMDDTERLLAIAVPAAPSDLEGYVLSRLSGRRGADWLDRLPLYAVIDACETMGAVALHGPAVRREHLTFDDWRAAGDAGFATASLGVEAVRGMLSTLDASYVASRISTDGPQARYGALHHRLAQTRNDPGLDELRAVVADHVRETTPVGPEDRIFGKPFGGRLLHSIRSASLEHAVHPARLRKILAANGVISADGTLPDERTTFPAAGTEDLLRKAASSMSLSDVETYLNAGRVHAKLLAEEGFIEPFVTLPSKKAGEKNFARADLDTFLAALLAGSEAVPTPPPGTHDIPAAAKRANCRAGEIVRLILDRKLAWVGCRQDSSGFLSILVSLDEVKQHVHGPVRTDLTARDVEQRLRTRTRVVSALIAEGVLPTSIIKNPVNRCPTLVVRLEDVERFEAEYVSLNTLARERGSHFRVVKADLDTRGVRPALHADVYSATFYRRSDVA